MHTEESLKINSNLKTIYKNARAGGDTQNANLVVASHLHDLITIQQRILADEDQNEQTRLLLAEILFSKTSLEDGVKKYLEMFNAISKLPGAAKYQAQIDVFKNWLKHIKKDDRLLDAEIDSNLTLNAAGDENLLNKLIEKYTEINIAGWR